MGGRRSIFVQRTMMTDRDGEEGGAVVPARDGGRGGMMTRIESVRNVDGGSTRVTMIVRNDDVSLRVDESQGIVVSRMATGGDRGLGNAMKMTSQIAKEDIVSKNVTRKRIYSVNDVITSRMTQITIPPNEAKNTNDRQNVVDPTRTLHGTAAKAIDTAIENLGVKDVILLPRRLQKSHLNPRP